jgi:hypothetical protein
MQIKKLQITTRYTVKHLNTSYSIINNIKYKTMITLIDLISQNKQKEWKSHTVQGFVTFVTVPPLYSKLMRTQILLLATIPYNHVLV